MGRIFSASRFCAALYLRIRGISTFDPVDGQRSRNRGPRFRAGERRRTKRERRKEGGRRTVSPPERFCSFDVRHRYPAERKSNVPLSRIATLFSAIAPLVRAWELEASEVRKTLFSLPHARQQILSRGDRRGGQFRLIFDGYSFQRAIRCREAGNTRRHRSPFSLCNVSQSDTHLTGFFVSAALEESHPRGSSLLGRKPHKKGRREPKVSLFLSLPFSFLSHRGQIAFRARYKSTKYCGPAMRSGGGPLRCRQDTWPPRHNGVPRLSNIVAASATIISFRSAARVPSSSSSVPTRDASTPGRSSSTT